MLNTGFISPFYMNTFAKDVSAPYSSFKAYKDGLIDDSGNVKGSPGSFDSYEYFVIKLKKIFEELPSGLTKAKLNNYMSTLMLFSESAEQVGLKADQFNFFLEGYIARESNGDASYFELLEDMATGGGAGAIGVPASAPSANQGGVSGFDPVMAPMQRRNSVLGFENNCEMFDVCPEEFEAFKTAKAWRHVPEGDTRNYLQRYQRRNPSGTMAVRNSDTNEVHWLNLKPRSLVEELGLDKLDIMNDSEE
jgi:hypothetical protein